MIAGEFDFDPGRAVIIEHRKSRVTSDAHSTHWHVLVGEIDPASGKVLRCSFDRVIHELVARWSEYKFGHKFVQGNHTKSVIGGLRKRGAVDAASSVEAQLGGALPPSGEAFTHAEHQARKRAGTDLPVVRQAVKHAMSIATTRAELESILSSSSLLVMPGDKPDTWIVTDGGGEFIGSLARLAGSRKSEITKVMGAAGDEPASRKTDNPTSNFDRSASHPQPAGATKRPTNARPPSPYRDTVQNPGSSRKGVERDREHQSETGLPQKGNRDALSWLAKLDGYSDQLSLLLGKANMLSMPQEERIIASLWEIEEQARADLSRHIPVLDYSEKTQRLRVEAADLEESSAKKWDQLFCAEERLRKAKRPRWWHYLLGIAFVFERQHRHLALVTQQASDELEACKHCLEAVKSKLLQQEVHDKQRHADLVRYIAQRKKAAGPTLAQVDAANEIIRLHPALAFCGLNFVLARATAQVDEEKRTEAKVARNLDDDGFGYKR
ncbi:hypothetical protein QO002_003289 [Pararhizobium capsulatum DSM 1112]|uniref:Uncharacterized protein n=1 Tax=Pararhizobium capsulatum DSM 1112 TaxID=1121113 RepID=A0ABU0BSB2_9HYPH|nr:hypothetical protein [Pararhizobium capsulatum]MDQ0321151.1 hypothetical protein [Pararhizobium capsulatum DSM 1112]